MELERRAYAPVGLLGNPSDVYGGRAVSFTVAGLWATVRFRPSDELLIEPHPRHDLVAFPSLTALAGLSGSSAIVCAALSCLLDFYNVRDKVRVNVRPNLILDVEKELGSVVRPQ